jgi:protocatechuate 3,4-dioxygenase beta subunit
MPEKLTTIMKIVPANESGDKLFITGTVLKSDGKTPYPNVILYAYQTDNTGYYPKNGNETGIQKWHGYLHGWCKTDSNGYYEIHTIRPACYPDNSMPAHIHTAVKLDSGEMLYLNDFVFKDDDLVNQKYLSSLVNIGGTGVVDLYKNSENVWTGKRDVVIK